MNVLLIGGGGREHALAWAISQSPMQKKIYVTHQNSGFQRLGAQLCTLSDVPNLAIDLAVIGPEAPLADGLADELRKTGIAVFGPSQQAAQIEASKAFCKAFMDRHNIPTAEYVLCHNKMQAQQAIKGPCVVKADGLAAGKGVFVCETQQQAIEAVDICFSGRFGAAGEAVLIEERLIGPEVSVIALCDGDKAIPLLPCRDHKRRFDDDKGPNTGGMGAICPPPDVSSAMLQQIQEEVLKPVVAAMKEEGMPFIGALYAGLMLCDDGPKVLEFNVRFGDPETQPLMMMLDEDWLHLFWQAANGCLEDRQLRWRDGAACCVTMAGRNYPLSSSKGVAIERIPNDTPNSRVFFAGVSEQDGILRTNGGRVLSICHRDKNIHTAIAKCYEVVSHVKCSDLDYRTDIGR